MAAFECRNKYIGETYSKTATRIEQHKKSFIDEEWNLARISDYARNCIVGFKWNDTTILKLGEKRFESIGNSISADITIIVIMV